MNYESQKKPLSYNNDKNNKYLKQTSPILYVQKNSCNSYNKNNNNKYLGQTSLTKSNNGQNIK